MKEGSAPTQGHLSDRAMSESRRHPCAMDNLADCGPRRTRLKTAVNDLTCSYLDLASRLQLDPVDLFSSSSNNYNENSQSQQNLTFRSIDCAAGLLLQGLGEELGYYPQKETSFTHNSSNTQTLVEYERWPVGFVSGSEHLRVQMHINVLLDLQFQTQELSESWSVAQVPLEPNMARSKNHF